MPFVEKTRQLKAESSLPVLLRVLPISTKSRPRGHCSDATLQIKVAKMCSRTARKQTWQVARVFSSVVRATLWLNSPTDVERLPLPMLWALCRWPNNSRQLWGSLLEKRRCQSTSWRYVHSRRYFWCYKNLYEIQLTLKSFQYLSLITISKPSRITTQRHPQQCTWSLATSLDILKIPILEKTVPTTNGMMQSLFYIELFSQTTWKLMVLIHLVGFRLSTSLRMEVAPMILYLNLFRWTWWITKRIAKTSTCIY